MVNKQIMFCTLCLAASIATAETYSYRSSYAKTQKKAEPAQAKKIDSPITPLHHWFQNRIADFCDIFNVGVGVTAENPITGPLTPSFGLYLHATDYVQLGYLQFAGASAEWDGRGFGAYTEIRDIWGYTCDHHWDVQQGTEAVSFYKDPLASEKWRLRMDTTERYEDASAHIVVHPAASKSASPSDRHPRGWHNFAYTGLEAALPLGIPYTPLDTHLGLTVRAGIDTSQVADFLLGFIGLDFWHDDLRASDVSKK